MGEPHCAYLERTVMEAWAGRCERGGGLKHEEVAAGGVKTLRSLLKAFQSGLRGGWLQDKQCGRKRLGERAGRLGPDPNTGGCAAAPQRPKGNSCRQICCRTLASKVRRVVPCSSQQTKLLPSTAPYCLMSSFLSPSTIARVFQTRLGTEKAQGKSKEMVLKLYIHG